MAKTDFRLKNLAKRLFNLTDTSDFTIINTDEDPRGFAEIYGPSLGEIHTLSGFSGDIMYRSLCCFWDSLSVEIIGYFTLRVSTPDDGNGGMRIDFISSGIEYPSLMIFPDEIDSFDLYEVIQERIALHKKEKP